MTDKAFEPREETCDGCGMDLDPSGDRQFCPEQVDNCPSKLTYRKITSTGSPVAFRSRITEEDVALERNPEVEVFEKARKAAAEADPERRALAINRLNGILAGQPLNFFQYLDKAEIPYNSIDSHDGRKAIIILLEDIAESDMRKS